MFIAFEGIDGCGKSTLLENLALKLSSASRSYVKTREPGGSSLGSLIRTELLSLKRTLTPQSELLLFLADRSQHVLELIRPGLAQNKVVLCDRYIASTLAYQRNSSGLSPDKLKELNQWATGELEPDLYIYIDLSAEQAQRRRAQMENDRMEAKGLAFQKEVRQHYLDLAQEKNWLSLDGQLSPTELCDQAWSHIQSMLP